MNNPMHNQNDPNNHDKSSAKPAITTEAHAHLWGGLTLAQIQWIGFKTLVHKEIYRMLRIWIQTLLPPVITTTLYFAIFGNLIGPRVGAIQDYSYMQFIAPGLIMMAVISNAYGNTVSSFYGARFQRNIEEVLVSPCNDLIILLGYTAGGVLRGLLVGALVTLVALVFTHLHISHYIITFTMVFLTATLFSQAGFLNAIFSRNFDDITIIPTFILTPLTYFGGVFYSIDMLPHPWQDISRLNPIVYMVNTFRYGVLGISDISIPLSFGIVSLCIAILFTINMQLLRKGVGIRT